MTPLNWRILQDCTSLFRALEVQLHGGLMRLKHVRPNSQQLRLQFLIIVAAYMNIFISTWVILTVGLIFTLPMLIVRVREHTELAEEIMVRMDEHGKVRDVSEVEENQKNPVATGGA